MGLMGPHGSATTPSTVAVALATSADWPDLSPDDRSIAPALARAGATTEIAVWTDDRVGWERFDLIVVRSCWDYHNDLPRWLAWLDAVEKRCRPGRLCNRAALLRWNARKTYLGDLGAAGVPVVPTRWLGAEDLSSEGAFRSAVAATGWREVVVKPAVSAGALGTYRLRSDGAGLPGSALGELMRRGPVLVQPYLSEIAGEGEWSLIFFDGVLSHAVRKCPAVGDFRVQEKHGGTTIAAAPPPSLVRVAERTLESAAEATDGAREAPPLYARVDLVVSAGAPLLMELEVTEPALFLAHGLPRASSGAAAGASAGAADRFARAIVARARHVVTG